MIPLNFSGLRPRFFGAVAGGLSVGDSDGQQPGVTKKDPQDGGVKGSERADSRPKLTVTGRALAPGQGGLRPNRSQVLLPGTTHQQLVVVH